MKGGKNTNEETEKSGQREIVPKKIVLGIIHQEVETVVIDFQRFD